MILGKEKISQKTQAGDSSPRLATGFATVILFPERWRQKNNNRAVPASTRQRRRAIVK